MFFRDRLLQKSIGDKHLPSTDWFARLSSYITGGRVPICAETVWQGTTALQIAFPTFMLSITQTSRRVI